MADLTDKTKLVRDPVAGLRSLLSQIALVAPNPAIIPLRSIGGDSDSLASRWRDCAGNESSRPGGRGTHRLRGSVVMQECFPDRTQEQLYSKPPLFAVSRWRVNLGKRVPAVSRVSLRADGPVH
jgi:hypothetical protein